jgi:hypothetical protein
MLPDNIRKFFWEYDGNVIDVQKNWFFIIERLLEYGDFGAVKWSLQYFGQDKFIEVVKTSRNISKKTASMWQNYFNFPKEEIKCMNIPCQKTDMPFLPN